MSIATLLNDNIKFRSGASKRKGLAFSIPSNEIESLGGSEFIYKAERAETSTPINLTTKYPAFQNCAFDYFEIEILEQYNSIIIGFTPEENPIDNPPGDSSKYSPNIGISSTAKIMFNGRIITTNSGRLHKKRIGIGYDTLEKTCFFTVNGRLKKEMRLQTKKKLFFTICFFYNRDRVIIRFNNLLFDFEGYIKKKIKNRRLISESLKDYQATFKYLMLDYTKFNGYSGSYKLLKKEFSEMFMIDEDSEEELTLLTLKKRLRVALRSKNWELALYLVRNARRLSIPKKKKMFNKAKIYIKVLKLLDFFKNGQTIKAIKYARDHLKYYKKETLPVFNFNLVVVKVENLLSLVYNPKGIDQKWFMSEKVKHKIIEAIIKSVNTRKRTKLEKIIQNFKYIERMLEKRGLSIFKLKN